MSAAMSAESTLARSHFELVGGQAAVDRIVEEFYRRMDVEPAAQVIRVLHPPDLSDSKAMLKRYLAEWLGGPAAHSRERGHSRLRMRHLAFRIGTAERDAWMLCMAGALAEVVGSNRLREYLLQSMSRIADWMCNAGVAH
jgi:hemoglobin